MTVCSILQQLTAYIHLGMRPQHCGIFIFFYLGDISFKSYTVNLRINKGDDDACTVQKQKRCAI